MTVDLDMSALILGGLVATRTLTFLMTMPVLGMRGVPTPVRIALGVWMAVAVLPTVRATGAAAPTTLGEMALALSLEVLAGFMLAFGVVTVFATVQFAGQMIGIQIGFAMANVIDPTTDLQVSVVSQVFNVVTVLLFLAADGHLMVLQSLGDSFRVLVPGNFTPATAGILETARQIGSVYALALRLALPVVMTLLLVSLSLGLVGRTVPQLNILVLGFPIKILVGCFVLFASIPLFGDVVGDLFADLPERLGRIVWASATGR